MTLMERLEASSTWEPNSGCRIWLGAMVHCHGALKVAGQMKTAHRVAWELERGPIPKGLWVLHTCGLGLCFNVNHLRLGTRDENAADRSRHGGYVGKPGGGLLAQAFVSSLPMGRLPRSENAPLDHAELRRIAHYDPETGVFTWRVRADRDRSWNAKHVGNELGSVLNTGYRYANIHGKVRTLHRLAWLWMTGEMPGGQIDHINGERADNRWCNLRLATSMQNGANQGVSTRSTSGTKGVTWDAKRKRWYAKITVNRKQMNLGYYLTLEEAAAARRAADAEHQGEFARNGVN